MSRKPAPSGGVDLRSFALPLLKFILVGLLNTGIDFGLFLLLSAAGLPYLLAHAVSFTAALINSFLWNKLWTFRAGRAFSAGETARFLAVNLAALAVSGGVLALGTELLHISEPMAKAIALPFSFAVNYLGNRFWVFPRLKADDRSTHQGKDDHR